MGIMFAVIVVCFKVNIFTEIKNTNNSEIFYNSDPLSDVCLNGATINCSLTLNIFE